VDRVGRHFPFCIARATDLRPEAALRVLQPLRPTLETAALWVMDGTVELAAFDDWLCMLNVDEPSGHYAGGRVGAASIWETDVPEGKGLMTLPHLPAGPKQAAALFDLAAPYWTTVPTRTQEA
jgi:type VI secretion system protein ImpM